MTLEYGAWKIRTVRVVLRHQEFGGASPFKLWRPLTLVLEYSKSELRFRLRGILLRWDETVPLPTPPYIMLTLEPRVLLK